MRKAKALHLCAPFDNKKVNPEGHSVLKKMIALAYLPLDRVIEGLEYIEKLAFDLGDKAKTTNSWAKFFAYYRKEWIQIVKPINFSVIKGLRRTNNHIERYHRSLNELMGSKPDVKHFVGKNFPISSINLF